MTNYESNLRKAITAIKDNLPETNPGTNLEPRMTDYGNCAPGCPTCQGLGFIGNGIEDPQDPKFGRMIVCPNKPINLTHTGIQEGEWHTPWETLIQTPAVVQMRRALSAAIQKGSGLIYLHGSYGIGKTVCLKAATILAAKKGFEAYYTRHSDLINHLRSSYDSDKGQVEYENRLKYLSKIRFLAIDEFGRSRQTEFGTNAFSDLLDTRYEGAITGNLITIIASNYAPEEILERYQEDRVRDSRNLILELTGTSMRSKLQPQPTQSN